MWGFSSSADSRSMQGKQLSFEWTAQKKMLLSAPRVKENTEINSIKGPCLIQHRLNAQQASTWVCVRLCASMSSRIYNLQNSLSLLLYWFLQLKSNTTKTTQHIHISYSIPLVPWCHLARTHSINPSPPSKHTLASPSICLIAVLYLTDRRGEESRCYKDQPGLFHYVSKLFNDC